MSCYLFSKNKGGNQEQASNSVYFIENKIDV